MAPGIETKMAKGFLMHIHANTHQKTVSPLFPKILNTFVISWSKNMKVMSRYWFGLSCFIHQAPMDKLVP